MTVALAIAGELSDSCVVTVGFDGTRLTYAIAPKDAADMAAGGAFGAGAAAKPSAALVNALKRRSPAGIDDLEDDEDMYDA